MSVRVLLTGIQSHAIQKHSDVAPFGLHKIEKARSVTTADLVAKTSEISNTGNYLIGEGVIYALRNSDVTYVHAWKLAELLQEPGFCEYVEENFDYVALSTANMLRSDYSADLEHLFLEKIKLPSIVLGIGLQRVGDLSTGLPAGTRGFIEELRCREHTIFTRGFETANFLKQQGLEAVYPSGCPSLYLSPRNVVKAIKGLKDLIPGDATSIALNGYIGKDISPIRDVNRFTNGCRNFHYVCQDEFLYYGLELADIEASYDDSNCEILADCKYLGKEYLKSPLKLFIFFRTDQWRIWSQQHDFSLGYRFHGNVISMQAGVPGIPIVVDDRMREMLRFSGLPGIELEEWNAEDDKRRILERFLEKLDTTEITDRYLENERNFSSIIRAAGF